MKRRRKDKTETAQNKDEVNLASVNAFLSKEDTKHLLMSVGLRPGAVTAFKGYAK